MPKTIPFLGLEDEVATYYLATAVLLPVPWEHTTSYGKGTRNGPAALLRASRQVELYDEELCRVPAERGIATLPFFEPHSDDMADSLAEVEAEARRHLEAGKFLVTLGGEHSLTQAPVRAARTVAGEIGVVQLDAHADLRDTYDGTPFSHACVMRRIVELGIPTLGIGIRSLSRREAAFQRQQDLPIIWGYELERAEELLERCLPSLPEQIYLTIDVDFFDPSLVPATGTPEPGGGTWYSTLRLLRRLFTDRQVIAMDIVELAPIAGQPASDFTAARLLYKCLGYGWEPASGGS